MTIDPNKPKKDLIIVRGGSREKPPSLKIKVGSPRSWIPPGKCHVTVKNIEKTRPFKDKWAFQFTFEVSDGEYHGVQLRGFCNANYETYSQNTKLFQWLSVVTGDDFLEPGDELDLNVFFDKLLEVKVEEKISKKTKNKFSNVTEIIGVVCEL